MKAAFYTLGCKVNQYETQALSRRFEEAGFALVPPEDRADVYVINSCTVTASGDKKTRQLLRHFRRKNPEAVIVLAGCYPQAFPGEAAGLLEADVVRGTRDRARLLRDVQELLALKGEGNARRIVEVRPHERDEPFEAMRVREFSEHTRAFVKIEDGCDRWCSYCIIPKARGPVRSRSLEDIREELSELTAAGYREIVLVGINLSSYGKDTGWQRRLTDAVELACSVPGVERLRLGSLEPDLLTVDDLDRLAALPQFCPQFHLSLQSGCEATLCRMNRHYTPKDYLDLAENIRRRFSNPSITTDIMVGFPGETEEEFACSLDFARRVGLARAHVFAYSPREGTRAAGMEHQIPQPVKERRSREMIFATDQTRLAFWQQQVSTRQEVLFETLREDGTFIGYTKNYTPVIVRSECDIRGEILPVLIEAAAAEGCAGTILLNQSAKE